MDGLPVGEYLMLLSIYLAPYIHRFIRFDPENPLIPSSAITQVVSSVPPVYAVSGSDSDESGLGSELLRDLFNIPSDGVDERFISLLGREFREILIRYQETGDFSELHKRCFFSSESMRFYVHRFLSMMVGTSAEEYYVRCHHRIHILQRAICSSFGVVDLTPPLQGVGADVDVRYFTQISGVYMGMNPRDIAIFNAENGGSGPRVSFDLVGAPLD
jgi:hypothetical protein